MAYSQNVYIATRAFNRAVNHFLEHVATKEQITAICDASTPEEDSLIFYRGLDRCILVADAYAALAQRIGMSELFKKFVTPESKADDVCKALKKKAPSFAKLCV